MDLCEALKELAVGSPDSGRLRFGQALERVYQEILHLLPNVLASFKRSDVTRELVEDAAHDLADSLLSRDRIDALQEAEFPDENHARRYLKQWFVNTVRDLLRKERRHRSNSEVADDRLEDGQEGRNPAIPLAAPSTEEIAIAEETGKRVADLERMLVEEIARCSVTGENPRKKLLEDLQILQSIRDGTETMEALIEGEAGPGASEKDRQRARNRLDQRFSRTLRRLHAEVRKREAAGELSEEDVELLRRILNSLRLRSR